MDDSNCLRNRLDGQSGGQVRFLPKSEGCRKHRITRDEDVTYIRALVRDELPFPKDVQVKVCKIIQLEQGNGWTLYGKTGWEDAEPPGIGWWVGWLQRGDRLYSFVLYVDMPQGSDPTKRNELGKAILKLLGVL